MKKNIILGIIIVLVIIFIVCFFIKDKIIVRPNSDYVATIYHSQMMGMDAGWGSTYYFYPTEDESYMWIESKTTITIKGASKEKDVDSGIIKNQNELQNLVTDIENSKRPDAQQYISYTYINNGNEEKVGSVEELIEKLFGEIVKD
ncbi:MAG: hypothetical protein IKK43_06745 [Clostridia bacterium]|nr:hypothetical protein [Clostridia bacterium]